MKRHTGEGPPQNKIQGMLQQRQTGIYSPHPHSARHSSTSRIPWTTLNVKGISPVGSPSLGVFSTPPFHTPLKPRLRFALGTFLHERRTSEQQGCESDSTGSLRCLVLAVMGIIGAFSSQANADGIGSSLAQAAETLPGKDGKPGIAWEQAWVAESVRGYWQWTAGRCCSGRLAATFEASGWHSEFIDG